MALTINLPAELEACLMSRAALAGSDLSGYVTSLLEKILRDEQDRLNAVLEESLRRCEQIEPDPNRPRLRGQEAEIEAIIVERFRRQRLKWHEARRPEGDK